MTCDKRLVRVSRDPAEGRDDGDLELLLLSGSGVSFSLGGTRCYLDGRYLLCLSPEERVSGLEGADEFLRLSFRPSFFDGRLTDTLIADPAYEDLRIRYNYPDFRLFVIRNESCSGVVRLGNVEYTALKLYIERLETILSGREEQRLSRARSCLYALLRAAQNFSGGENAGEGMEILRYMRDHLDERITLESLCARFHLSRATLTRLVRELTGQTPIAYLTEERLTAALTDLAFSRGSIEDIARSHGFSDVNYFIRVFKKRCGKTPLQYRADAQKALDGKAGLCAVSGACAGNRAAFRPVNDEVRALLRRYTEKKIGYDAFKSALDAYIPADVPKDECGGPALEYLTPGQLLIHDILSYAEIGANDGDAQIRQTFEEQLQYFFEALSGQRVHSCGNGFCFVQGKGAYPEGSIGQILSEQYENLKRELEQIENNRDYLPKKAVPQAFTDEKVGALRDRAAYLYKILEGKIECRVSLSVCRDLMMIV